MRRAVPPTMVLILSVLSCGPWQRVGSDTRPRPANTLPRLFDAVSVYRSMGFWATGAPLPFVASLHYLGAGTPDSTVAVFALSLANHALGFRRDGNEFVAGYHVEVAFRGDSGTVAQIGRDETVRVRSFQETLRADESVIFQHVLRVPPGTYDVTVLVRDRNGPALGRTERSDTVPRFAGPALAAPVAYYEGTGRATRADVPQLLANPRATLPYGGDSIRFYVEGYDLPEGARLAATITDIEGEALWRDTMTIAGGGLSSARFTIASDKLPVGQAHLAVVTTGGIVAGDTGGTPLLVSFSNQWVITNFDEVVSLLRYFERQDLVSKLRDATPEQRPTVWREFWTATDPAPLTPENEAVDDYFRRVQQANVRFQEEGDPGWLTDRGEVFITLGDPDEVLDLSSGMDRSGLRAIRWTYNELRLTIFFQDQSGFGRFRLTPVSRAEYFRVLSRVRRSQ
jgi:GWxTD domain-containing protein